MPITMAGMRKEWLKSFCVLSTVKFLTMQDRWMDGGTTVAYLPCTAAYIDHRLLTKIKSQVA